MANSRDFTGKNRKFTGTKGIITPKGTTGQRVGGESGELRFNTTTELMEYYDGNNWKPIDAPPTISSISTSDAQGTNNILNADGSSLFTITITGGNFGIGANVKFIGNTGTEYTAGNINRISGSSITCTTLITMGTTDDPYDVQVINASGLSALLEDAFSFNAAPVFVNASGTLGSVYNGQVITGTTLNAGATDAEGNTITFSIISGALPGTGLTLSSSTGAITGTLASTPSLGNYSFNVRAATTEGNAERQFSIQVIAIPFIAATGGTILTEGDFKTHVFTGPGTFTITAAGGPLGSNSVEYAVVAGGGGSTNNGSGGGGAGGYRTNFPSPSTAGLPISAQGYPITVGGGGPSGGNNGSTSVFSSITSAGGGFGGAGGAPQTNGNPGGSGGGAHRANSIGTGNSPPVSPPQGNPGAAGDGVGGSNGGGGGGAGAIGSTAGSGIGAPGGIGSLIPTTFFGPTSPSYGTPGPAPGRYFAGGGAGSGQSGSGNGGAGGGGPGGYNGGTNGTGNTGGGAGGDDSTGGSGIVLIRYKFQ